MSERLTKEELDELTERARYIAAEQMNELLRAENERLRAAIERHKRETAKTGALIGRVNNELWEVLK